MQSTLVEETPWQKNVKEFLALQSYFSSLVGIHGTDPTDERYGTA